MITLRATWRSVAVAAGVGLLLAGCSRPGADDGVLTLTANEATLTACPSAAPVEVAALDTAEMPTCDSVGQVLVFPDGRQVQLPEQRGGSGSSSASDGAEYSWVSVGNWGIVAARASGDCSEVQEWGNPEGLRRVHEAFGAD